MNRTSRIAALFLLAFLLPLQGFAAACAQICAAAQAGTVHEVAMDHAAAEPLDHCGQSEMGASKCCKAHAFMIDVAVPRVEGVEPFQARDALTSRWTSFIPEHPSPPPIFQALS